ncbi:hypothetical protein SAFG77S_05883 [Streptomyces afghaniensis]
MRNSRARTGAGPFGDELRFDAGAEPRGHRGVRKIIRATAWSAGRLRQDLVVPAAAL